MFTRKERTLLHHPYFRIIREEEQFIEVQSLNTMHCWNVFKNQFKPTNKVKLYHKHKQSDKYYHEHRKCKTATEAVRQIRDHDTYVLEQAVLKEKAEAEVPKKATRQLKVYTTSGHNYKPTNTIILKGDQLEKWGFHTDSKIEVVCEEAGKLSIAVADE